MAIRWRPRVKRSGPNRYALNLPSEERRVLRHLLPQLRELVTAPPTVQDERVRRLFPTAYPDDAERDAEYQRYMREELVTSRLAAIDRVEQSLDAKELDEGELVGWMQSVNAIRLVLGTMLDISEETDLTDIDQRDPSFADHALYAYLSGLLDEIVRALSG